MQYNGMFIEFTFFYIQTKYSFIGFQIYNISFCFARCTCSKLDVLYYIYPCSITTFPLKQHTHYFHIYPNIIQYLFIMLDSILSA